jgi:mono/diheme cytochrome c family protein
MKLLLVALLAASFGGGAVVAVVRMTRPADGDAVSRYERGRRVAERLGCFACHGPDGRAGTTNFLPEIDEIPSWSPGTFKSYVKSPDEVREWIADGMPARMRKSPDELDRVRHQLIKMPAYRGQTSGEELDALVFYVLSCSTFLPMEEESSVARGRAVATRMGCFGCHGGEGRARQLNPGSFKGYIPAWDSKDYDELVRSPSELREWVRFGAPARLRDSVAASFFIDRQQVRMPAYDKLIAREELDDLVAYVEFTRVRAGP